MSEQKAAAVTGEGNALREAVIITCPGVNREQAFRRGSFIIGYGRTTEEATNNLLSKCSSEHKRKEATQ